MSVKKKILIITRCSRIQFLEKIHESIINTFKSTNLDYKWVIVFDMNKIKKDEAFNKLIDDFIVCGDKISLLYGFSNSKLYASNLGNQALAWATCKTDYAYLLDDDNCMHPDFGKRLSNILDYCKTNIIFFGQKRKTGDVIITNNINSENCLGWVDSAQFVLKTETLEKLGGYEDGYYIDGLTIRKFLTHEKYDFYAYEKVLSYYNYFTELNMFDEKENNSIFTNQIKSTDE